ncbi:type IV pilus assembly protein PilY1 [Herminiimonas fonticola]|uniref:Type IV pilus assembly protein PilY1 n=2 Tax=Herminiimonas fonticola TaxID=303380 RepID=A0A4R6GGC3_9BURK|nr:Neisseria PilC beta-propeller domain [Herminiimonas fonticola]TDN93971.1 type IV pilus assembly protein PilY1 [Herminiimonas fonticola]
MKYLSYSARFPMILFALMLVGYGAHAAETDIANAPLASSSVDVVKPNVMFILDDSGSMAWDYSPDAAGNFDDDEYGSRSNHCNGMYYNPAVTYTPPVNADGTSFADASFTAALPNGLNAATSGSGGANNPVNLNNSYYFTYSGATKALGFTYNSSENVDTSTTFYKECDSDVGSNPGNGKFTKVTITTASAAALKTNFANWYSYYRTRILAMKTAAGRAFKAVGSSYRVGYSTISYTGTDSGNAEFLKIADFDVTQKASFYTKLYNAVPSGGTPLRAALSKAGRIYAGKLLTGTDDPVQYSCQQNFTILSTDGYWNGDAGYQLDGTTDVGNQDATELRPMYDGTVVTNVSYTTATVTFSGSSNTLVSGIVVNGTQIMSGSINDSSNSNTVASRTAALISKNGYTATVSGNVVTIKAPTALGAITYTPVVTKTGGMTATATAFSTAPSVVTSGGVSNSLADVAAYYYNTDLRTTALGNCTGALGGSADVCENNVLGSGLDNKGSQHMTTFTLGLGLNGLLQYSEDYLGGGSADYEAIKNATKDWPVPEADKPTAVDDLWHAAVNGRGSYFSAQTPDTLIKGITKVLTSAKAREGSGVAAATSNLEPVAGDNFLFLAMYRTVFWDGDLEAKTIDPSTGAIADTASWSAQTKLDTRVTATADTRTIYTYSGLVADTNKLKPFTWARLTEDEQAYFNSMCAPTVRLSQCSDSIGGPNLTTIQRGLIPGENLLKFIRGQNAYEDQAGNANPIYRDREHVLGDMIGSQPVYVKAPPFVYVDANYDAYKTHQKDRLGMVYVAANDGMLHAFDATIGQADSGTEKWAYIPPMVLPNLYKLADKNYPANHQYYVDGAPTVGDICPNAGLITPTTCTKNEWKTILVGGLNAGGKGYYALDITDPGNPKALWNFTDANDVDLGYSYGNPVITKRLDGTWVVVFTSGYNNHTGSGDGEGHLYVLNADTGVLLSKLDTNVGDTTTPSGLAKINAWIDSLSDNTAKRFYGGDLLGNVWRFDPDDRIAPTGNKVTLLAELGNVSPIGTQSVTIKPELTEVASAGVSYPVVNVATGRYLGISDLTNTSIQSIYSLKDNLTETGLGKVRTAGVLVQQTLTTSADGSTRTTSSNAVDWASKSGWYMDLNPGNKSPGERVNVDMQQQLGLLTVAGNVPKNDACTPGGYAWIYSLDFKTGQFVEGATGNVAGRRQAGLVAGMKTLKLNTGKTVTLITDTGGTITVMDDPSSNPGSGNGARRVSWRELIAD